MMKGEDDTMAKLSITKLEVNTPNPNNPCSHGFSCAAVVEGVVNDEALREAVDMVCEALRKQVIGDEEKTGATADPEGAVPDADNDANGSADAEATGDEVAQEAGATHCDLSFLEAVSEGREVATDFEFIASMQDFLRDLAEELGVHDEPHISRLPAVADVICHYFCVPTESSEQTQECDGEGDNVKKWMDEAPDGDGSTASAGEGADAANNCDHSATTTRMPIPQRQYVHVSLPGGGHISLPEDYVFFGPSRVLENLF